MSSARRFVNLEQPEQSPLVRKASGTAHGGGATYPAGSAGYLLLLQWIQFGGWVPLM